MDTSTSLVESSQKPAGITDDASNKRVYRSFADVKKVLPKLSHFEYYTDPRIHELAAKERAEPGFCSHVQDFAIGRHGYGSIKFARQTDVQRLDLESIVQFKHQQVRVYMNEGNKPPPIGQGLNKPAEVTLLNCKCHDKITGSQILKGSRVEKFEKILEKKAEENHAKSLSYEPEIGEWNLKVDHFDKFELVYDEQWIPDR